MRQSSRLGRQSQPDARPSLQPKPQITDTKRLKQGLFHHPAKERGAVLRVAGRGTTRTGVRRYYRLNSPQPSIPIACRADRRRDLMPFRADEPDAAMWATARLRRRRGCLAAECDPSSTAARVECASGAALPLLHGPRLPRRVLFGHSGGGRWLSFRQSREFVRPPRRSCRPQSIEEPRIP